MKNLVQTRVSEHAEFVDSNLYTNFTRLFTALQGSQNYNMADENSDVDTKSVLVPNLQNLLFRKKPLSDTLLVTPTEEHADVKDFRLMMECWKKQNVNFMEVLFTPYVDVPKRYNWVYSTLFDHREKFAFYNPAATLSATWGHMLEKYNKFDHKGVARAPFVEKYGYDPKQLCHQMRLLNFLERYLDVVEGKTKETYSELLLPTNMDELWKVKRGEYDLATAKQMNEDTFAAGTALREKYKSKFENKVDVAFEAWLDCLTLKVFEDVLK